MLHKLAALIITTIFSIFAPWTGFSEPLPSKPLGVYDEAKLEFIPQSPSLETIFADDHSWTATLSAERLHTVTATGDIIPARSVNFQSTVRKNFKWSFEETAELLRSADITLINLESPLVENCPLTNEGMIFCGSQRHIEGFEFAGVDVASLENNHIENYGAKGVESTIKLLNQSQILTVRADGPAFKDVKGVRFAFLAYDDLRNPQNTLLSESIEKMTEEIERAKKSADIVVVSLHWGPEYTRQPTKRQKDLAHLAIDAGADLIIGNHPHWIQPVEIYKDKVIVYAHGNFIFDQMWSQETKEGVLGKYTFYDKQIIDAQFFPIYIKNYGQATWPDAKRKEKILNKMREASMELELNTMLY